uniref:Arf-GAP domain-containing protein n=1 Tax=Kalanchoe fedtschenkoi TaxID=63787 RepID=A0A7N0TIP5_KALFE
MISRKIEERNEKIVRGLLKLPPNRRCINCNSLGPQYVCTNFWTFVCTTCSGIHREFTHRVKSISMSKFTSQEVEALQNGGNQRARELYFKGWDFQKQRLPDSSNVDRVREFIKNVYEDKKYVTGKISDGPCTDSQSPSNHEEHRRASSYHSYSQSPPYDHQYEERKYGKRAPVLTRKPGSEKGLYEGKVSSFGCSPTRMSEQACDDRFTNESSVSRYSPHSESGRGDPFRSDNMSPSSYSNHGFGSLSSKAPIGRTTSAFMEENAIRDVNKVPHPQRTQSLGSFGSFDKNTMFSADSYKSNSQAHFVPGHDQSEGGHQKDKLTVSSMEKRSSISSSGTLDLFADPVVSQPVASSTADFFQLPTISASPANLFQTSTFGSALNRSPFQPSETSPPLNLFSDISQNLHDANLDQSSHALTMPKNEGWATFDTQPVPRSSSLPFSNEPHKSDNPGEGSSFSLPPLSQNIHHEPLQSAGMSQIQAHDVAAGAYPPVLSPWREVMPHNQAFSGASTSQPWNAFEDPMGHPQWESIPQKIEPQFTLSMPSADNDQYMNLVVMEGLKADAARSYLSENGPSFSNLYQHTSAEFNPVQQSYTTRHSNPFDLPFDLDPDPNKVFVNMNSLGAALPSDMAQSAYADELNEPWISQHPATTLPTSMAQASIPFIAGQSPTSQFTDVSPHGRLATIGGNPFA